MTKCTPALRKQIIVKYKSWLSDQRKEDESSVRATDLKSGSINIQTDLGFPVSHRTMETIKGMKRNDSGPRYATFMSICRYLNIDFAYDQELKKVMLSREYNKIEK